MIHRQADPGQKPAGEPVYACLQLPLFTVDPSRWAMAAVADRHPKTAQRSLFSGPSWLEMGVLSGLPLERAAAWKRDLVAEQSTTRSAGNVLGSKIFTRTFRPVTRTGRKRFRRQRRCLAFRDRTGAE